jgi:hypothetical protein
VAPSGASGNATPIALKLGCAADVCAERSVATSSARGSARRWLLAASNLHQARKPPDKAARTSGKVALLDEKVAASDEQAAVETKELLVRFSKLLCQRFGRR